ncbi:MAG: hypothetical protein U1E22_02345 [Coriobacteriia bacterium]|nr:hypothetical protein [Coriobacteriia bacterium]
MTNNTRIGFLLMLGAMPVSCSSAGDEDTTSVNDATSATNVNDATSVNDTSGGVDNGEAGRSTACGWPPACLEDLCRKEDCGGPASAFDEDGCYRPNCETDPCEAGHECREVQYSPVTFSGVMEDGTCMVGWNPIVITTKMCFPVAGE